MEAIQDWCPRGVAKGGEGFPRQEGPSGLGSRGERPVFPLPNWLGKSARLLGWVIHPQRSPLGQVGPGGVGGRPGENRRGRQEGPKCWRGGEGICSTYWGTGSLLGSQAGPLLSKVPFKLRVSWGHKREAEEISRGRWKGLSGMRGAGEEWRAFAPPTGGRGSLLSSQVGSPTL